MHSKAFSWQRTRSASPRVDTTTLHRDYSVGKQRAGPSYDKSLSVILDILDSELARTLWRPHLSIALQHRDRLQLKRQGIATSADTTDMLPLRLDPIRVRRIQNKASRPSHRRRKAREEEEHTSSALSEAKRVCTRIVNCLLNTPPAPYTPPHPS